MRFGETKDKYFNRSLRHGTEMRHRNLRSDSVLVHTGYIGTGAILVPGFGTQPYSLGAFDFKQQNDQCMTSKYRESDKRADGSYAFEWLSRGTLMSYTDHSVQRRLKS